MEVESELLASVLSASRASAQDEDLAAAVSASQSDALPDSVRGDGEGP